MRRSVVNVLVALLIAIFAIGAPIPAKADCSSSGDCSEAAAGMADGSCDLKGEPCKVAQNCAAQILKMPAQTSIRLATNISKVAFAFPSNEDVCSTSVTPEISPPRA
jgi:hypothetical protein